MEIKNEQTKNLIEYGFNNRIHSEQQVDRIANSIREFGFNQPIVVDEDNVILVGHGRLAAAKKLGLETVPVLQITELNDVQKRAYRILDNKLQNDSEWNWENLKLEVERLTEEGYSVEKWGLDALVETLLEGETVTDSNGEKYTKKIESPIYKITGEKPTISSLYDLTKAKELSVKIEETNMDEEIKEFLLYAAQRHVVFNYQKIAEYYAHASKEVQELMEESALVIIDFEKAIEKGFVKLTHDLAELYGNEHD